MHVQGIPPPNFHIVDALSTGLGLGLNNTTAATTAGGLEIVEREILRAVDAARGGVGGEGGGGGGGGAGKGEEEREGGSERREGRERRIVLMLDGLDFLLAATGATALQMGDLVGELRSVCSSHPHPILKTGSFLPLKSLLSSANPSPIHQHVHTTILTSCADSPLIHSQSQSPSTPLEIEHAAFVTGMAHLARTVISIRELDTGGARDVSGVLRVSRGGAWEEGEFEEREVLFFVGGDGGVRVFERGGGG